MKVLKKGYLGSMLAVVLMLGALLGACGTDNPTGHTVTTVSGVVTVGTPTAGLKTCTSCHPGPTAAWLLSRHANVEPLGNLDSQGSPTTGYFGSPAKFCTPCHDPQGDSGQLIASYTGNTIRPVVGCEACHSGGQLHADAGGSGPIGLATLPALTIGTTSSLFVSGQFRTCTACHALLNTNDPLSATSTTITPHGAYTTPDEIITDTHFASAGSYTTSGANLSSVPLGYSMDYASERVCTNCHDPHGTADVDRDWVNGPHGNTARNGTTYAWSAFNWSCSTNTIGCNLNDSTSDIPRPFCLRCHTTTGLTAYADANAAGDRQRVDDIWNGRVALLTYDPGWKPEMLKCDGCHTDNRGSIRNPGAYNAIYGFRVATDPPLYTKNTGTTVMVAFANFQYPDVSSSNLCILCHSSRNSAATIKALNTTQAGTTAVVAFNAIRASNTHGLPIAGMMFGAIGYEYEGRDYTNPSSFKHDKIGTSAVPGTGKGGPCVGCHMYRAEGSSNHSFHNLATYGSGSTSTTVVSSPVCYQCHAGSSSALGELVENEKLAYDDSVASLTYLLTNTPILLSPDVPPTNLSSSGRTNWFSYQDTDTTGNTSAKNNLGAVFNRAFLASENAARTSPSGNGGAGWVHNSVYSKRLLYDTIDWLDNNKLDYSTGSTLNMVCSVPTPSTWCARALPYLLPNGIANGAPSERP